MDDSDTTRKLILESTMETSPDFTDKVMDSIQDEKTSVALPKWQLYAFLSSLFLFSGTLFYFKWDITKIDITVPYHLDMPPMVLPVAILTLVLFVLNRFIALRGWDRNILKRIG